MIGVQLSSIAQSCYPGQHLPINKSTETSRLRSIRYRGKKNMLIIKDTYKSDVQRFLVKDTGLKSKLLNPINVQ